ncbi:MAG TPA: DNA internalization-related competence protein ComEC/Rec2 [Candidatus Polarisedimenticolia bacterium]|nr:DNA internalization-related competence protein ComEC/Rec2 [Candidatus Polarisedimenticolia bacterium]
MGASGWLAAAAVGAALFGPIVGPIPVILVAFALGLSSLASRVAGRPWLRRTDPAAIGLLVIGLRLALEVQAGSGVAATLPSTDGPWMGVVTSISAPRRGLQPAIVELDPPADLAVSAMLPRFPAVVPGDRVSVQGRLRPVEDDEYGHYLGRIGVSATLYAESLDVAPATTDLARRLEGLRRGSAEALALAVPEPAAGLAAGILVGLRDRVDRDVAAAFTTAGISHVVAISGWNIAIVGATIGALAGGLSRRRRSILICVAIALYVAFVGASASVLRAAAMAGVALLARESGRAGRAAAALGLAVVALLLLDPGLAGDAGFQLSSLATAGLIAWGTPLTARLAGANPGRPRRLLAESLGVSLAAQAATLPVILADFGRLSLVAPVVNLLVVPLVAPAMAAGAIALIGGWLALLGAPAAIATVAGLPAWALLSAMIGIGRAGAGLPFASVALDPPWSTLAGVIAGAVILVIARRRARRSAATSAFPIRRATRHQAPAVPHRLKMAAAALLIAVAGLGIVLIHRPDGIVRVTVLDVGQGDAILVEGGAGGRLLVDGGPDPDRLLVALDERLPPWDRRIDVVILTHPHEDHVAGLVGLLARYRVGRVFEPGMQGPGPGFAAWRAALAKVGRPIGTLAAGDQLRIDAIRLRVLWPVRGKVPLEPADGGTAINNVSIVLLGEVAGRRFLLAGDVEEDIDPSLIAEGLPHLDLLKVAHHGSKTASTDAFLESVRPSVTVVSAGTGNPYGHPAPSTIARLEATGARVYRTDRNGSVEVSLEASRVSVSASGPRTSAIPGAAVPTVARAFTCAVLSATG